MGSRSNRRSSRRCTNTRRGAAAAIVLISLSTLLAMAMMVIDLAYMRVIRGELQSAADAASLACIQALDMDADVARHVAEKFAALNQAAGKPVALDRQKDVVFGTFDEHLDTFIALDAASEGYADAVQVTVSARGVRFYFAPLVGINNFGLSATSTARYKAAAGGNIVGLKKVELKNDAYTDSYNSGLDGYSAATATSEGGVSSNGNIKVEDSAIINGNAYLPSDANLETKNNGYVNGSRINLSETLDYPEVDFSNVTTNNNNGGIPFTSSGKDPYDGKKLEVKKNDTLNLPPGAYLFEEIKLEDNAVIIISDVTRIFVTKKIDAENGAFDNQTRTPNVLQLNSTQDHPLDEVKLPKNYDTYAVVYAPSAKVTKKGSSHFYGSIIADELKAEGGGIHADRALLRSERGTGATAILVE